MHIFEFPIMPKLQRSINRCEYQQIGSIPGSELGVRHLQILLLFFGLLCAMAMRVNLSVAIVAMVDRLSANPDFQDFGWSESTQSLVLSSFFWGYVITQIPGGQLAERYGAKLVLAVAVCVCSLLNLLTPVGATYGGWGVLCALRVVQGLSQGVIFPSCHLLLSKWAPISERGRLGTLLYSGGQMGTVVMLGSSGFIASSALGWPGVFYISGSAGILWSIIYLSFGSSSPDDYKLISPEEKEFIESSKQEKSDEEKVKPPTPWLSIITSPAVYALIIVHCGHNWGFWTLLTEMPTYMKNILGMDIKKNALLTALPYFVMGLNLILLGLIGEIFVKKNIFSLATSRRVFNTIGHWVPMVALIGLGYVTADKIGLAVTLLTIAVGINATTYLGFQVNHIDLAPNFAGTLMGITNCVASIMSFIAPLLVGFIVTDNKNPLQWRTVFFISSAIYFAGNLVFLIMGRFSLQPWNGPRSTQPKIVPAATINESELHNRTTNS